MRCPPHCRPLPRLRRGFAVDEYPCECPRCGGCEVCVVGGFEDLRLEELDVD
jgi:hypothetical protein